ncbi:hypothetical protein B484DRAFT_426324, partial [Ochromonadaceae sp. CCMP2298]
MYTLYIHYIYPIYTLYSVHIHNLYNIPFIHPPVPFHTSLILIPHYCAVIYDSRVSWGLWGLWGFLTGFYNILWYHFVGFRHECCAAGGDGAPLHSAYEQTHPEGEAGGGGG